MFGLEVVAVAPFVVAMWRLAKKVGEQQNLIDAHEATINSQQEVLNALSGNAPSGVSSKVLAIGGAAAVAAVTLNYAVQLTATRRVGTVRPPESYEPTPALSENEECKICMGNKKDTVFMPCRHYSTCWPCACKFLHGPCPQCRETVEFIQFLYDS
ncbi:hypothetical protein AGDE_00651 [Angomonas deanei]|uniref:Zinc finger, C3HC4 type (RING finger) containing protein, putative n=1 Tax=Angomonas deanei TaxID=59799 RepID=S9WV15_9TRYP|nr:hypothetical protein AGDE_04185 [Angomonas deanei]EPY43271.1 hypothetical protein AGDE_00651 [Angomonas deanei]CAD2222360.1 Zinc finger, C3HC4 type (RING finger) containing protein, putative [Angomonas deanei]|eukprot:EPY39743.1 hypothetical protein AGDE_04185 [Angomonas deanei]